jgi:hypothetical protein
MKAAVFTVLLAVTVSALPAQTNSPGSVNFGAMEEAAIDAYTVAPTPAIEQWFDTYFQRMAVYAPYFNTRTAWYPNGLLYDDMYAVAPGTTVYNQYPQWIMHDQYGNQLYLNWGCSNGTCPAYAGDFANPAYRAWWISNAQATLSQGNYKGLWIDDVNMNMLVSDANGNTVDPIDDATGQPMTYDAWMGYVAQFMTQVRAAFPNIEITENVIWFSGPVGVFDAYPAIQTQLATATNLNLERGITNDPNLTGGTGMWSIYNFFSYIDRMHALGPSVTLEEYQVTPAQQQYGLASYFLINNGNDRIGDMSTTPGSWFNGYSVALGAPTGPRTYNSGVFQRNFTNGIVLLGEPGLATQTITLPGTFQTLDGTWVSSVSLSGSQGIILTGSTAPIPPQGTSGVTRYLSEIPATVVFNSWGVPQMNMSIMGNPIKLDGVVYPEGLGVHAYSELHYPMYGNCWSMSATVGVDDEIPPGLGYLTFQVWADGALLYNSGYLVSGSPAPSFSVNLRGYQNLSLVVTNGIYDAAYWQVPVDHADWANAIITCGS